MSKILDVVGLGEMEKVRVRWEGLELAHDEWVSAADLDSDAVALYQEFLRNRRLDARDRVHASGHNLRARP